ncbi:MAG: CHAD domain-containing protein [Chloroflexota bacterium]|nr:MAG: hypothetical protein DLM70_19720 [Chloroflexota bacterium]
MVKAGKIPDFDCSIRVDILARRVLHGRADDMHSRRAEIGGPGDVTALHNLRIAGKRLRYSLETFAFCFSKAHVEHLADRVRALQDVLGRIHDLDVLIRLLKNRAGQLDGAHKEQVLEMAAKQVEDEDRNRFLRKIFDDRRHRQHIMGLYQVMAAKLRERAKLYAQYEEVWTEWEREHVLQQVRDLR